MIENLKVLLAPKRPNGFFVIFPGEKNEQKIQTIFSNVMADLIYKNYLPKPTSVFSCDKTGDYYFSIEARKPRPSLKKDLIYSLSHFLEVEEGK